MTAPHTRALLRALAAASHGLVYSSESDRPFVPFFQPAAHAPEHLTTDSFAPLVDAAPDDPVEEQTLDRFFAQHVEYVEPVDEVAWERRPRYEALKRVLRDRLRDVHVFRIGRVQVRCFVVGRGPDGDLVGLETVAVET